MFQFHPWRPRFYYQEGHILLKLIFIDTMFCSVFRVNVILNRIIWGWGEQVAVHNLNLLLCDFLCLRSTLDSDTNLKERLQNNKMMNVNSFKFVSVRIPIFNPPPFIPGFSALSPLTTRPLQDVALSLSGLTPPSSEHSTAISTQGAPCPWSPGGSGFPFLELFMLAP